MNPFPVGETTSPSSCTGRTSFIGGVADGLALPVAAGVAEGVVEALGTAVLTGATTGAWLGASAGRPLHPVTSRVQSASVIAVERSCGIEVLLVGDRCRST
ncbi:hypothetical protein CGZ93_02830 [Enemella dayhoffiae]|uniref:Uncharacterized protein n=1 Tax=Enemella dayhoffiae TaxID=2016507 RepID=A0A255HAF8_9ACTN|nr:hypothetical protein CGZ93_02830 [Enemella dayhoffiae]